MNTIDKIEYLKRTANRLVPACCLGFRYSGKLCFVDPVSANINNVPQSAFSFPPMYVLIVMCFFVGIHRHFVLYGLMEYLRKRWLHWNSSMSTTVKIYGIWGDHILYFAALTVNSLLMRFCNYWTVSLT